jgi:hypothetical protein
LRSPLRLLLLPPFFDLADPAAADLAELRDGRGAGAFFAFFAICCLSEWLRRRQL